MRQLLSGIRSLKFFKDTVRPDKIIQAINTFERDVLELCAMLKEEE